MAQVGIREFDGKKWLLEYLNTQDDVKITDKGPLVLVTPASALDDLAKLHPWLKTKRLVVKPDQLFGKRGKHGLLGLNLDFAGAKKFLKEKMGKKVRIGKSEGILTHFLIEPFVPHTHEYYLAITTEREGDRIHFSREGGMEVEENWEKVKSILIPVLSELDKKELVKQLALKGAEEEKIADFMVLLHGFFKAYGFTYLELNPFIVAQDKKGASSILPLDMVAKVDSTAIFEYGAKWGDIEFPAPFGRELSKEEAHIAHLDEQTGASLKLTVLNPEGRIWTMVAGGGASVIYTDTICDLGFQNELANYGEYSGDPAKELTYEYAKTILYLMTRKKHPKGKYLIIGGGIANFTDVAKTFEGIIQALIEYQEKLRSQGVRILVRRGGPNYQAGLARMSEFGKKSGINMEVFGPETHMTRVVSMI